MNTTATASDIYTGDNPQIRVQLARLGAMAYMERGRNGYSDNKHIAEIDRLTDKLVELGVCVPRDTARG